jgi:hypothetical protein
VPSPYSGDDEQWPTSTDLLDDADLATPAAALWNVPDEASIDKHEYLKSRLLTYSLANANTWALGQKVLIGNCLRNDASRWAQVLDAVLTTVPTGWVHADTTSVGAIVFEVMPPHAMARLASVEVQLEGAGYPGCGDHAGMVGTKPTVEIYSLDGGVATLESTTTDPTTTQPDYDDYHRIDCVGPDNDPMTIGQRMLIVITGEGGANAANNHLCLWDITCHWTSQDEVL